MYIQSQIKNTGMLRSCDAQSEILWVSGSHYFFSLQPSVSNIGAIPYPAASA